MYDPAARQSLEQQKGEMIFRRFHRSLHKEVQDYMEMVLKHRIAEMRLLLTRGLKMSPFLEIGTETGANSLALTNGCGARGYALDISLDALDAMQGYAGRMGLEAMPYRICADAQNLPFVNGSLGFELCWGTLHHFPDPKPVVRELRRVVRPDGALYFDGEPVKRLLSLHLWQTPDPMQMGLFNRMLLKSGLLPWLADVSGEEPTDNGALENRFSVKVWKNGLSPFELIDFDYKPVLPWDLPSAGPLARLMARPLSKRTSDRLLTFLFGGTINGIARPGTDSLAVRCETGLPSDDLRKGGELLLRKQRGHDLIKLLIHGPLPPSAGPELTVENRKIPSEIENRFAVARLPQTAARDSIVKMRLDLPADAELKGILFAGDSRKRIIIPASRPSPPDPNGILACPACLIVNDRCAPDLCGTPCIQSCPRKAVSISNGRAAIDPERCRPCMSCAYACPLQAIDRQPLQGDPNDDDPLTCPNCASSYPAHKGVRMLLEPRLAKDLYPEIQP